MSDLLCFTNRNLCRGDFLTRIEEIAACHPAGIVLREKDLEEAAYQELAVQVLERCKRENVCCILHNFVEAAVRLKAEAIHLPLPVLRNMDRETRKAFRIIGASCHSAEDAKEAELLGCTYITAGHIFETDCKRGLPGRGTGFLREVVGSVDLPVYAIGGIDCGNIGIIRAAGAKGACVMSGAMQCANVKEYFEQMKEGKQI